MEEFLIKLTEDELHTVICSRVSNIQLKIEDLNGELEVGYDKLYDKKEFDYVYFLTCIKQIHNELLGVFELTGPSPQQLQITEETEPALCPFGQVL